MIGAIVGAYAGYRLSKPRSRVVGTLAGAAIGYGGDYLLWYAMDATERALDKPEKGEG